MQLMKFSKSKNGKIQKENLKQKIGEPTPPLQWLKRINLHNCTIFYYLCIDQCSTCALYLTQYLQVNFTLPLNRRLAQWLSPLPSYLLFRHSNQGMIHLLFCICLTHYYKKLYRTYANICGILYQQTKSSILACRKA